MSLPDPPPILHLSIHILLLNPNSSLAMTRTMESAANRIAALTPVMPQTHPNAYAAPEPSPASIDNDEDIQASVQAVVNDPELQSRLQANAYDAVLVACYSVHPLVKQLAHSLKPVPVIGILEASILTALSLIPTVEPGVQQQQQQQQWGIVTTGAFWEAHLCNGVAAFLGQPQPLTSPTPSPGIGGDSRFAGVFSTGLNAGDFHTTSQDQISMRLREATKRLLSSGNVNCVVMGCGGMGGLQDMIRTVVIQEYGQDRAKDVCIVDGVQAGVLQLQQAALSRRFFGVK
ncbi:hydantoin racemase [Trichoderma cornu-damae]|uniref:Hydantoin racemase n=1 Tax=Trichoderma cornu-damae TaxID=654480 RepID=A0A9P8TRQ9_9HYPO|nr:hydantoin racemase [Trichoderma cornu-damae]